MIDNKSNKTLKSGEVKQTASYGLSYASLIVGVIYINPMLIMYLCYNLPVDAQTASDIIVSIESILFIDFYILTLPEIVLCFATIIYNICNRKRFGGRKIKFYLLTVFTFVIGVTVVCFAAFFIRNAW